MNADIAAAIADCFVGVTLPLNSGFDPFCGTGVSLRLFRSMGLDAFGVELEPEWASMDPDCMVGDATDLPFDDASMGCCVTSPTYGNRLGDSHTPRNEAKAWRRITYTHYLGRKLAERNTGQMYAWQQKYVDLHRSAWAEAFRVLASGGLMIVNTKDFLRTKKGRKEQIGVTALHLALLTEVGFEHRYTRRVKSPGMRLGANRERVEFEDIIVMVKP
jgi:tRNA G10  N-methylase Trm11